MDTECVPSALLDIEYEFLISFPPPTSRPCTPFLYADDSVDGGEAVVSKV